MKVYNGWGNEESRIKKGKNTLRRDKISCHRFEANQARLKMGALAYNLVHMIRKFHLKGEDVKQSMGWLIRWIIKAASRLSYSGRRWWVHVASSFPLAHHYRAVLGTGLEIGSLIDQMKEIGLLCSEAGGFCLSCLWLKMTEKIERNVFCCY